MRGVNFEQNYYFHVTFKFSTVNDSRGGGLFMLFLNRFCAHKVYIIFIIVSLPSDHTSDFDRVQIAVFL